MLKKKRAASLAIADDQLVTDVHTMVGPPFIAHRQPPWVLTAVRQANLSALTSSGPGDETLLHSLTHKLDFMMQRVEPLNAWMGAFVRVTDLAEQRLGHI